MQSNHISEDKHELVNSGNAKTSAGGAGGGGGGTIRFRGNEKVMATVVEAVRGGYDVYVDSHNAYAFVRAEHTLRVGQQIRATFGCVYKNRNMLLSFEEI
jgi:hypothetical protein